MRLQMESNNYNHVAFKQEWRYHYETCLGTRLTKIKTMLQLQKLLQKDVLK